MTIGNIITELREKRITFSIHDSVGTSVQYLWMDMWFWNSEDVKLRAEQKLPTRIQVSALDINTLFDIAIKKLEVK